MLHRVCYKCYTRRAVDVLHRVRVQCSTVPAHRDEGIVPKVLWMQLGVVPVAVLVSGSLLLEVLAEGLR